MKSKIKIESTGVLTPYSALLPSKALLTLHLALALNPLLILNLTLNPSLVPTHEARIYPFSIIRRIAAGTSGSDTVCSSRRRPSINC